MKTFKEYLKEKNENLLLKGLDKVKKFQRNSKKMSADEKKKELEDIYDEIFPKINERMKEFVGILKKVSKKYKHTEIKTRIKPLKSVISKVINRNKSFIQTPDLIGGMIITRDKKDTEKITKDLQRKFKKFIKDVDIKKIKGSGSGYHGAVHIDMDMKGVLAEVQILPRELYKKKNLAHKIYTQTRDSGPAKQDMQIMRKLFVKGNLNSIREDLEDSVDDLIFEDVDKAIEYLNA